MRGFILTVAGLAVAAAGFSMALPGDASAAERIRWKLAGGFPSSGYPFGPFQKRVAETITEVSGGEFEVKFFEPGALIPPLQSLEAIGKGSVESAFTSPGFHTSKLPVSALFSSIPFGPDGVQQYAWLRYGGGLDIYNEYLKEHGAKSILCGFVGAQIAGWFRKPINAVEDFRGLKMRFFGYGARVMERLGVATQLLAPGDIYPALELGTIDATELGLPTQDQGSGFFQVAKHMYFPSWHEPYSFVEFLVNLERFQALPKKYQTLVQATCDSNIIMMIAEANTKQPAALKRFQEKGVTIHQFPEPVLGALREAWGDVVAQEAAKDPKFKRAWDSLTAFRAEYEQYTGRAYKGL